MAICKRLEPCEPVEVFEGRILLTDNELDIPQLFAELVLLLACQRSSRITGSVIYFDDGESLRQI